MVKSITSANNQPLYQWLIQRVSAVVMALYVIGLAIFFLQHPDVAFYEWHSLFNQLSMKIATAFVIFALLYHAWIGMWTVYTDYIKLFWLRLSIELLTIIALIAMALATLLILWGV